MIMTTIVTSKGIALSVGRLPRKTLDDFAISHPPPIPPTITKKIFGGEEQIENFDDEEYKRDMFAYHVAMGYEQTIMILPAITLPSGWRQDTLFLEMIMTGAIDTSSDDTVKAGYLTFVAISEGDIDKIVREVFYQSTTTERGIREAENLFNVTWFDQSVYAWRVKSTPGKFSRFFEDREAARFGGYTWEDFSNLSGQDQSAVVAHYRLYNRLECLVRMMETK